MALPQRRRSFRASGFTLVELILVMGLLGTVMAFAAPMLSRSLRDRHLQQEGIRLLGMAELCRNTAISEGVPMLFWIDSAQGRFGMEPKAGFETGRDATRDYALGDDVWFEAVTEGRGEASGKTQVEFAPDGVPETAGVETIRLGDRFGGTVLIARTEDGWGYEIVKETEVQR